MLTRLTLRVAARHQAAAQMTEEKLKELLLKIRKGATSSLNWSQLGQVLAVLDPGWELNKIVGLVKLYRDHSDDSKGLHVSSPAERRKEVEATHEKFSKAAVQSLPSSPQHGQLYVLDLSNIEEESVFNGPWVGFTCKPWMGHEGWEVVTPTHEVFTALPTYSDLHGGRAMSDYSYDSKSRNKIVMYDVLPWLNKNTDWLEQINRKLNMDPHGPAVPRTRENTGSCPVCFQNIKLSGGDMVLHGYKRPGSGSTHGKCSGYGWPAFETSVAGTKNHLESLQESLVLRKKLLRSLEDGEVTQLDIGYNRPKLIGPDDPQWDRALKAKITEVKQFIEALEDEIKTFSKLVQHWKPRPLPKEGEMHINWYFQGQHLSA
jgi:hypothetical protein